MLKKLLTSGMIILFLFCSISFTTLSNENSDNLGGKTLYVGGSGPGNYTKIQDAIDDASDGDTVFVYSGTYYEQVDINISLALIGQDKNSTIIDGMSTKGSIVRIRKSNTQIVGFTVSNTYYDKGVGVYIERSNIIISDNIITDVYYGINFEYDDLWEVSISNCLISNCIIRRANTGINLYGVYRNNIYGNMILNNNIGINFDYSWWNYINNNTFKNNNLGIFFDYWWMRGESSENEIMYNNFIKNDYGILINDYNPLNIIAYNNFMNNRRRDLSFAYPLTIPIMATYNIIAYNYWDRPRLFPKVLFGYRTIYFIIPIPWILLDLAPAQEPYDIPEI